MFVRVKSIPNSPRKTVQIVHSFREGSKVRQKVIKYIGVAHNDKELEELKLYATKYWGVILFFNHFFFFIPNFNSQF